jgi:Ca2+-transporting ATPase
MPQLTPPSNRRLDNKLNIFEGITRNYFFIIINLIMVGGQVLIIFVGGEAFRIHPLNGKEWGMSIGLGAISLPWGALIRKFPDEWAEAMVPHVRIPLPNVWPFKKRKAAAKTEGGDDIEKAPSSVSDEKQKGVAGGESSDSDFDPSPPLRTLTSIRGKRASMHIRRGFREYMHDQKVKVKVKAKEMGGSKTDVSAPGVGGKAPELAR